MLSKKSVFPPGFRFHPTDEELVLYYLKRKMCRQRILLDAVAEADVYKWDPQDLPHLSALHTGDRQWFFFTPRGARSHRGTLHGYWKATGKDRTVTCNARAVGVKKTLVFYKGRAPLGERTDWVMHEYTLDNEEVQRCRNNVYDHYALCKVFKKSGPGPKNGEQYGALFREEDWADPHDEDHINNGASLEELLNRITDEPQPLPFLDQLVHEDDTASSLLEKFSNHSVVPAPITSLPPFSEALSAPVSHEQNQNVVEEDFIEDFLEMNDLLGPEPTSNNSDVHAFDEAGPSSQTFGGDLQELQFDYLDGLTEFDLYHDAPGPLLLYDITTAEAGQINNFVNGAVNPVQMTYTNSYQNQIELMPLNDGETIVNQMWSHDQRLNTFNPSEADRLVVPPASSGVVYDSNLANRTMDVNQNQIAIQDDGTFSSQLWAFVDSIPTTPAAAAESPMVNRALKHMSSVSRVRINARNINVVAGNTSATSSSSSKSKNGIFSFVGILCATFLIVLVGVAAEVLGGCISS